ncbi:MAG: hypothetical protein AAF809_09880 [Bacteroidota bacterium]
MQPFSHGVKTLGVLLFLLVCNTSYAQSYGSKFCSFNNYELQLVLLDGADVLVTILDEDGTEIIRRVYRDGIDDIRSNADCVLQAKTTAGNAGIGVIDLTEPKLYTFIFEQVDTPFDYSLSFTYHICGTTNIEDWQKFFCQGPPDGVFRQDYAIVADFHGIHLVPANDGGNYPVFRQDGTVGSRGVNEGMSSDITVLPWNTESVC